MMAASSSAEYDYLVKVILVGDSGVGKSCLLKRYMGEEFDQEYVSTIGVDFEIKQVSMHGQRVHLQIWDTAGQERFRTITTSYYRSSDAILTVFDVTEENSFLNVEAWLQDVRQYARAEAEIILVGNKVDLEKKRVVDFASAKEYADENGLTYIETSAKTGANVDQAFQLVTSTVVSAKMGAEAKHEDDDDDTDDGKRHDGQETSSAGNGGGQAVRLSNNHNNNGSNNSNSRTPGRQRKSGCC
eukprot:TRINITY_DN67760_c7_g3_i4.p1 TRINITY_DN67760_c7_g3~~TRINITY_DN67760_c7_g3_i4.p1  ORF type:complete len:265 (+),score=134.56 TRINITY_DN67760_c7_g3_i4:68-796(+)